MEHPLGYVAPGENKVCRLKKTIYGLKHSPQAWFEKFSIAISGVDFHVSLRSLSLFGTQSLAS